MNKKKWRIWQHRADKMGWDLEKVNNLYAFTDQELFLNHRAVFTMSLKEMKKCLRGV